MLELFQILEVPSLPGYCDGIDTIKGIIDTIVNIIKIVVPTALILMGSIDLAKAVFAGKDDDIKKATGTLFKRFIAGIAVFLVSTIVSILIGVVSEQLADDCTPEDKK